MSAALRNAKNMLGVNQDKQWYEELEDNVCSVCPSLTWEQRLYGCAICMFVGFCLSMGSVFRLIQLLEGNPVPFAVMYTLGNLVSISSTCILFGPWSQAKQMFAPTRFATTTTYFVFMGLTLFLAFFPGDIPGRLALLVIAIICQFTALAWYTLSFIPFGRDFVRKFFAETCCDPCGCTDCGLGCCGETEGSRGATIMSPLATNNGGGGGGGGWFGNL